MTTFANQIDKRMAMQNGLIVIDEKKEALYRRLVSPRLMDELKGQIVSELVVKQKFKDPHYTAAKLAEDLGTNTRYISAVVRVRFHTTFTNLVNKMRVEEAMSLLPDPRYGELSRSGQYGRLPASPVVSYGLCPFRGHDAECFPSRTQSMKTKIHPCKTILKKQTSIIMTNALPTCSCCAIG